jgi:hypothetical protein
MGKMLTTFGMKTKTKIGFWNVRTLRESGKLRQVIKVMEEYRLDILGISETRWLDFGGNDSIKRIYFPLFWCNRGKCRIQKWSKTTDTKAWKE